MNINFYCPNADFPDKSMRSDRRRFQRTNTDNFGREINHNVIGYQMMRSNPMVDSIRKLFCKKAVKFRTIERVPSQWRTK
jgi:hypothetical protein